MTYLEFSEQVTANPYFTAEFTKKDGTVRKMNGCLDFRYIEEKTGKVYDDIQPVDSYGVNLLDENAKAKMVRVFDVENNGWRTLNLDTIQSIEFSGRK